MRRLEATHIFLRPPELRDFAAWAAIRESSRAFLTPWEPTWAEDELTRASFRFRLRRYAEDMREGRGYPFLMFRRADEALVGGINVSRVQRGVAQMCSIGYWVGEDFQGQGFTTEAVDAVARYCFEDLGLHRVEAACQPHNLASRRVLVKAGFTEEGFAQRYLKIDGDWRDHVLYGLNDPRDRGEIA
jgi:[ribosomal protein S5]-alanine N-acetyltransferase